jgi:hypothetical protein
MEVDKSTIARIALEAQLDPRTVKNAIERGVDSVKGDFAKKRLRAALKKLKLEAVIK